MKKTYQLYTITNTKTGLVYVAHTTTKVNPKTRYFSTNKALYDDLMLHDFSSFRKDIVCITDTQNEIRQRYREYILTLRSNGVQLYNDRCAYGFIYLTTNKINGMRYIGQHRISGSQKDDVYLGSGKHLMLDIEKFGRKNFERTIIEECQTEDELNDRERYWIAFYNAVSDSSFYNIAEGGDFGDTWTGREETSKETFRAIIALSNKRRKRDTSKISGNKNPAFGRCWYKDINNNCQYYLYPTDPLIEKLNLVRGMFRTKEHNMKIGNALRGKKKNYQAYAKGCRWMHLKGTTKKIFVKETDANAYIKLGYTYGMKDSSNGEAS